MKTRRAFLGRIAVGTGALAVFREGGLEAIRAAGSAAAGRTPAEVAADEDYWREIQQAFTVDRSLINLNNGGVSPVAAHRPGGHAALPRAVERGARLHDVAAPGAAGRVGAQAAGRGLRLRPRGDGDHPQRQRGARDLHPRPRPEAGRRGPHHQPGLPAHAHHLAAARAARRDRPARRSPSPCRRRAWTTSSTASARAITPRTQGHPRLPHHEPHRPDLPGARRSAGWGASAGIEVIVDGAHAFAHFPFKRADLDCDYYGTSLHKWLLAPHGTGFLYVRQGEDRGAVAAHGRPAGDERATSASSRRSAPIPRPTTTRSRRR